MKIKKNHKGASAGGCIVAILVIAAIAVLVFFLLKHFGIGFGGDGDGDGEKNDAQTSSVQEVEPVVAEYNEVEVVIKGDKYGYNGGEYELDALIEELNKLAEGDKSVKVNITQDNGLADALDALVGRLKSERISYADMTTSES